MPEPLSERIRALKEGISFHTPGHSGGVVDFAPFDMSLTAADLTETELTDNLLKPEGVIAESEAATGKAYNTPPVLYSTSGAGTLMLAAVYRNRRKRFLVFGAAHKSVYNALRLSGAEAWQTTDTDIVRALSVSGADAVILTSPDYFGNTLDLDLIRRVLDEKGVCAVVDAAHGAHFAFSSILPDSATEYFDTVIHSMHKTMPVMTGGAIMHVKESEREEYLEGLRLFHTTSPSYPIMMSIECAANLYSSEGERLYAGTVKRVEEFKRALTCTPYRAGTNDDPTRVTIEAPSFGKGLSRALAAEKIYTEFYYDDGVVLIVTPYNADRLVKAAEALRHTPYLPEPVVKPLSCGRNTFRLEFGGEKELVGIEKASGRRLYDAVGYYPPGTPLLFPGQRVGAAETAILNKLCDMPSDRVFGLESGGINVLK